MVSFLEGQRSFHVFAISPSMSTIAMAGEVSFSPKGFNLISYKVATHVQGAVRPW